MECEVITGLVGQTQLFLRGYLYSMKTVSSNTIRWRCVQRKKCKCSGRVTTTKDIPYSRPKNLTPHTHPPDESVKEMNKFRAHLLEASLTTEAKPVQVLASVLESTPDIVKANLGNIATVKRHIRRKRQLLNSPNPSYSSKKIMRNVEDVEHVEEPVIHFEKKEEPPLMIESCDIKEEQVDLHECMVMEDSCPEVAVEVPNEHTKDPFSECPQISLSQKQSSTDEPIERHNRDECEVGHLKSVVSRLETICDKFECGDSYEQFGKYIASLLRGLPLKEVFLLKQQIVESVLRVKFAHEQVIASDSLPSTLNVTLQPSLQTNYNPSLRPNNISVLKKTNIKHSQTQTKSLRPKTTITSSSYLVDKNCFNEDSTGKTATTVTATSFPPRTLPRFATVVQTVSNFPALDQRHVLNRCEEAGLSQSGSRGSGEEFSFQGASLNNGNCQNMCEEAGPSQSGSRGIGEEFSFHGASLNNGSCQNMCGEAGPSQSGGSRGSGEEFPFQGASLNNGSCQNIYPGADLQMFIEVKGEPPDES